MSNKEEEIKIAGLSTKTVKNFIKWGILLSILGIGMTVVVFAVYGHFNPARNFDFEKIDAFGSLLSGLIGVVLTLVATLLILLTYNTQKKELAETVSIASKQSVMSNLFTHIPQIVTFVVMVFKGVKVRLTGSYSWKGRKIGK